MAVVPERPTESSAFVALALWSVVSAIVGCATVWGDPAFSHRFDGPGKSWQFEPGQTTARILVHDHLPGRAGDASGCERIVVSAAAGTSTFVASRIPAMPVLDELHIRAWAQSNRPGVQLAARVVLPRSIDPSTGAARFVIVRGERHERPGHWQQLSLDNVPPLVADEVRVWRTTAEAAVDAREAFVDAVVLIVPGDPQGVEVLIEQLDVDGVVSARESGHVAPALLSVKNGRAVRQIVWHSELQADLGVELQDDPSIGVQGTTLQIEGKPFLPRGIEWNGERLELLAERGFNVVQLPQLPTDQQSLEAAQHQLWFLATPPRPDELSGDGRIDHSGRVLAWYLADDAVDDPGYFRRWAELVRQRDGAGRPIVLSPQGQWAAMSGVADILVAGHPAGSSIAPADFDRWLGDRARMVRPGTLIWAKLPTQLGRAATSQASAMSTGLSSIPSVDDTQVEALVHVAATNGCRGFIFQSRSSIGDSDAVAKRRAMLCELVNARLQLIEPWLAAGTVTMHLTSQASGTAAGSRAVVLRVDHARLLMPLELASRSDGNGESSGNPQANRRPTFVVPGVPNSHQVLRLTPVQLQPIGANRVAGGTSIVLEPGDDGWVLFTEEPQVIHSLRRQVATHGSRIARRQQELASENVAAARAAGQALVQLGVAHEDVMRQVATAEGMLQQADALLTSGRIHDAYHQARAAGRMVRGEGTDPRRPLAESRMLFSDPLATSYDTLVDHARLVPMLKRFRGGENLLNGGDFENLDQLLRIGWQHFRHPVPGVDARAELSAVDPQEGKYCLRLSVEQRGSSRAGERRPSGSSDGEHREIVADPPVWITSPRVPLEAGQVIEISGWVRIPEPIRGSVDGLQIVDTLGGNELALRIREATHSWQRFRMLRAVPVATELQLSFVLSGIGTAKIDGVMVRRLRQPIVRRLPPVESVEGDSSVHSDSDTDTPRLYATPRSP